MTHAGQKVFVRSRGAISIRIILVISTVIVIGAAVLGAAAKCNGEKTDKKNTDADKALVQETGHDRATPETNTEADQALGTPVQKNESPDDATVVAPPKSGVLNDPVRQKLFVGFENLKTLPPEDTLETVAAWFASDKADYIIQTYGRDRKSDIAELRKNTRIGPPIETYYFHRKPLMERSTIAAEDLILYSYQYPLIRDHREIVFASVGTGKNSESIAWSEGSWYGPAHQSSDGEPAQKRVIVHTVPSIFTCQGTYPENADIVTAEFICRAHSYGEDQSNDASLGPLRFNEICSEAQRFFDSNLRPMYETNPGFGN